MKNRDFDQFKKMMVWLENNRFDSRSRTVSRSDFVEKSWEIVQACFPATIPMDIQRQLHGDGHRVDSGDRYLYLRPLDDYGLYPIVSIKCNFNHVLPTSRLWLYLLHVDAGNEEINMMVYRFDMPEGRGDHRFYHVQSSTPRHQNKKKYEFMNLLWKPAFEHQPSLPLPAENPSELILCMMIAVYGSGSICEEMCGKTGAEPPWWAKPKYFKMDVSGRIHYFQTLGAEEVAKDFLQQLRKGSKKIVEIEETEFDRQRAEVRHDLDKDDLTVLKKKLHA